MDNSWYYVREGTTIGPVPLDEIRRQFKMALPAGFPVWREGYDDWKEASEIDSLRELFLTPAPDQFKEAP
jgi:hypothetical protein